MNLIAACKLLLLSRCWHFPKFDFLLFLLYTHNQHALVNMKSLCLFVKYIDATPQLLIIINYNPSFWLTAEITRRWWTYKKKIIFMKFIIYPKLNNLIKKKWVFMTIKFWLTVSYTYATWDWNSHTGSWPIPENVSSHPHVICG